MSKVSLIIGSTSDREIGDKAEAILKEFGVDYDYQVYSAHRNPKVLQEYIEASDASVYIAVAGLSAALPGFVAAHTLKPVIGPPGYRWLVSGSTTPRMEHCLPSRF
jgi:5-(carboxyamino)imidazole ribonucleotide mutase